MLKGNIITHIGCKVILEPEKSLCDNFWWRLDASGHTTSAKLISSRQLSKIKGGDKNMYHAIKLHQTEDKERLPIQLQAQIMYHHLSPLPLPVFYVHSSTHLQQSTGLATLYLWHSLTIFTPVALETAAEVAERCKQLEPEYLSGAQTSLLPLLGRRQKVSCLEPKMPKMFKLSFHSVTHKCNMQKTTFHTYCTYDLLKSTTKLFNSTNILVVSNNTRGWTGRVLQVDVMLNNEKPYIFKWNQALQFSCTRISRKNESAILKVWKK